MPPAIAPAGFFGLLFLNSFMAYFTNLTNFLVTKHTSALTLQVRPAPACRPVPACWSPRTARAAHTPSRATLRV